MEKMAKTIIVIGIFIVLIGVVVWLLGDKLKWIGRLPGDIRIVRDNFSVYIPITTMLLLSALLSVIVWVVKQFGGQ